MSKSVHVVYIVIIVVLLSLLLYDQTPDPQTSSPPEGPLRLAILEFEPHNDEAGPIAETIEIELSERLAGNSRLVLVPKSEFAGRDGNSHQLWASELMIDLILEGAVNTQGDRIRVSAQLIDGSSDLHLWAETYSLDINDRSHVVNAIASQVALASNDGS